MTVPGKRNEIGGRKFERKCAIYSILQSAHFRSNIHPPISLLLPGTVTYIEIWGIENVCMAYQGKLLEVVFLDQTTHKANYSSGIQSK